MTARYYSQRRHPRLARSFYADPANICSLTTATLNRRPVFAEPALAAAAVDLLLDRAHRAGLRLLAFCLMPDHLHLVIAPSPTCDLITFVGQYKSLTQRLAWRHGVEGRIWQRSFWDHFVRAEEDLGRVVEYVLRNPERRGLVEDWQQYPYAGAPAIDEEDEGGRGQAPALPPGRCLAESVGQPSGEQRR